MEKELKELIAAKEAAAKAEARAKAAEDEIAKKIAAQETSTASAQEELKGMLTGLEAAQAQSAIAQEKDAEEKFLEEEEAVPLEIKMERALISSALLLSRKEIGVWVLGTGWKDCSDELPDLIKSGDSRAMCLASEVVSGAATIESARHIVTNLVDSGVMQTLIMSDDRDIRSGAASAVAKLGLSDKGADEGEIIGLLQAACQLLEDGDDAVEVRLGRAHLEGDAEALQDLVHGEADHVHADDPLLLADAHEDGARLGLLLALERRRDAHVHDGPLRFSTRDRLVERGVDAFFQVAEDVPNHIRVQVRRREAELLASAAVALRDRATHREAALARLPLTSCVQARLWAADLSWCMQCRRGGEHYGEPGDHSAVQALS